MTSVDGGAVRIREIGDSALLLDVGATGVSPEPEAAIDADVNARAIAIAAAVRRQAIPGVRDVVSTFRSVAAFFDPLSTDIATVAACLHRASDDANDSVASGFSRTLQVGNTIEVPVAYGGEFGPDLDEVASFAGCSPQAVIERHASRMYRVFMLGFLPGFAYMASVDESIAAPRCATPRVRVPAGSVGIAGRQTAIYPRESPGGWQIIGRTLLNVFDPDRTPPALFAPGDQVRFVPTSVDVVSGFLAAPKLRSREGGSRPESEARPQRGTTTTATRYVTVVRPGLLTTIQDSGRWGYQDSGVPVSGPMDAVAHRLANAIVGNPREAATLEVTLLGPELRFEQETGIAIAGADLGATIDGLGVPLHAPVPCRAGSTLRFGDRRAGARAYVAFDGGIAVAPVLGSRATHLLSRLGGIDGRAVTAGDRIPLGQPGGTGVTRVGAGLEVRSDISRMPDGGVRLRVLPGPQSEYFVAGALDLLQRTRFTISTQSDRMGYRLTGGASVPRAITREMISDVTFPGGVQMPPSGDPILLLADRQTTGGYPQIAVVITADLPRAAQLAPGDWVEFEVCTHAKAIAALIAQEGKLLAFR